MRHTFAGLFFNIFAPMSDKGKKIVLAFDSFKGSLASCEVAAAFASGLRSVVPGAQVVALPVADGGEGTLETLVGALRGEYIYKSVQGSLGAPVNARYGVVGGGECAVVEMAAASGLTLLAPQERNPWLATTYGTGELIADALERGCRKFLVGIGGSATNDGGVGMLRALGYRFFNKCGTELQGGGNILGSIARIDTIGAHPALRDSEFIVACDVDNPLYGENGAAFVYAPQKGADEAMVQKLDSGLRNYAAAVKEFTGCDVAQMPGAGAAGGLGAAFMAMLGARLVPGVSMVLDALSFTSVIADASLVVAGEGRIDRQTMMGKAPCGVLRAAQACGVPVVAVGGSVVECEELCLAGFAGVYAATPCGQPLETAMQPAVAKENLARCGAVVAADFAL